MTQLPLCLGVKELDEIVIFLSEVNFDLKGHLKVILRNC